MTRGSQYSRLKRLVRMDNVVGEPVGGEIVSPGDVFGVPRPKRWKNFVVKVGRKKMKVVALDIDMAQRVAWACMG